MNGASAQPLPAASSSRQLRLFLQPHSLQVARREPSLPIHMDQGPFASLSQGQAPNTQGLQGRPPKGPAA